MHVEHRLEVVQLHLGEGLVAQNAGVVDQDVHPAPSRHGIVHHALGAGPIAHRPAVGDGLPAGRLDFPNNAFGGLGTAAGAVHGPTEVIDHHLAAPLGQLQRMAAAKPPAGAGDDGDSSVKRIGHVGQSPCAKRLILIECGQLGWQPPSNTKRGVSRQRNSKRTLAQGPRFALTARPARRIGRTMERRHPWLASMLAVAVTVGGVVCACAAGPLDAPAAATHAAHHATDHAPVESASCERADCTGSCEFSGTLSEREPLPVKPPNVADDFEQVSMPFPIAALTQGRALSPPAPPSRPWRRPDTPVHRFDVLLN